MIEFVVKRQPRSLPTFSSPLKCWFESFNPTWSSDQINNSVNSQKSFILSKSCSFDNLLANEKLYLKFIDQSEARKLTR